MMFINSLLNPRLTLATCMALLPFAATADTALPYTVISSNTPEKVAVIEPVLIDRSGLSVAAVDLKATGGLTEEAALVTIASSRRPALRETAEQGDTTTAALTLVQASPATPQVERFRSRPRASTLPNANRPFGILNRGNAVRGNRQLPQIERPVSARRIAPAAGPTYLLGVFR
jgi:hypothetical protein